MLFQMYKLFQNTIECLSWVYHLQIPKNDPIKNFLDEQYYLEVRKEKRRKEASIQCIEYIVEDANNMHTGIFKTFHIIGDLEGVSEKNKSFRNLITWIHLKF